MAKQPEQILEEQLVAQLQRLGYGLVQLKDEKDLIGNLKSQFNVVYLRKSFKYLSTSLLLSFNIA